MNIETGATVRCKIDSDTSNQFPAGTICKVHSKEWMPGNKPPLDFIIWVSKEAKRSDGETILHRAPFYQDELELVNELS